MSGLLSTLLYETGYLTELELTKSASLAGQ